MSISSDFVLKFGMMIGQVMRFSKTTGYKLLVANSHKIQSIKWTTSQLPLIVYLSVVPLFHVFRCKEVIVKSFLTFLGRFEKLNKNVQFIVHFEKFFLILMIHEN